jgi:hypothetical protein
MSTASPVAMLQQAQAGMRRSAVRRQLESVASGKATAISIPLDQAGVDVGALIDEISDRQLVDGVEVQRLVVAFTNSGLTDHVIERLSAKSPQQRARSARILGALRLYEGVHGWRDSSNRAIAESRTPRRALGKIGGALCARALVTAIHRRG